MDANAHDVLEAKLGEATAALAAAGACAALIHDVSAQMHSRQQLEAQLAEEIRQNPNRSAREIEQQLRLIAGDCPAASKIGSSRDEWTVRYEQTHRALDEARELARKIADRERTRTDPRLAIEDELS